MKIVRGNTLPDYSLLSMKIGNVEKDGYQHHEKWQYKPIMGVNVEDVTGDEIDSLSEKDYQSAINNLESAYASGNTKNIDEARAKINANMQIVSEQIAIIPTNFQTEIETYEFQGRVDENTFLVYISTETGKEEKIFMVIDTPGGELAI